MSSSKVNVFKLDMFETQIPDNLRRDDMNIGTVDDRTIRVDASCCVSERSLSISVFHDFEFISLWDTQILFMFMLIEE